MSRNRKVARLVRCAVVAACAGLLFGLLQPSTVGAVPGWAVLSYKLGEQQGKVSWDLGGLAIGPEGTGQTLMQTFTANADEWLGYVLLPVVCAEGVELNVKIRERMEGPILSEVNVQGLSEWTWNLIRLYDPALPDPGLRLYKGNVYAIEVAAVPTEVPQLDYCAYAQGPPKNTYRGGQGFYKGPPNPPYWLPLLGGGPEDNVDLPFATLTLRGAGSVK